MYYDYIVVPKNHFTLNFVLMYDKNYCNYIYLFSKSFLNNNHNIIIISNNYIETLAT